MYYRLILVPWKTFGEMSAGSLQVLHGTVYSFHQICGSFLTLSNSQVPRRLQGPRAQSYEITPM